MLVDKLGKSNEPLIIVYSLSLSALIYNLDVI